jgi:hypothetical protein
MSIQPGGASNNSADSTASPAAAAGK